jgi:hypothetical protein
MLDFLKKKKDNTPDNNTEADATDITGNEADDKTQHGPDVVGGVPVKLSETLNKIRGQEEKDFQMVELDDDGNIKKDAEGNPIIIDDASDDEIAQAKEGDTSSGETNDSLSASEEDDSVAEADTDDSEDERIVLDPRLEEAGKKMNWSDEKIISIAKTDMSILEDLADRFDKMDPQHRQEDDTNEDTNTGDVGLSDEAVAKLKDKLGDEAAEVILNMRKENAELRASMKDVNEFKSKNAEQAKQQAEARRVEIASELFDKNAEAFPEFGITKDLPMKDGKLDLNSPQMKVREEIYVTASMFHKQRGGTFSSAMSDALSWHAGRTGTVNAQRKLIKELNDRKTRFSPKPTRRKMAKVFKNADAKGANIVKEAKRKAGIEE